MSDTFTYKKYYAGLSDKDKSQWRDKWLKDSSVNRIKLIINGVEIPSFSSYSYIDVKSYFKEPSRSALGVINNLNSYATFMTPKLKISFKSMPISAYRTIMRLIREYNEFTVTAYDIVSDSYVVRKMYFSPSDYPNIFNNGYEVLRANEEEFELIGTNADIDELSIVYHSNTIDDYTAGLTFFYGQQIKIGDYDEGSVDPKEFKNPGYTMIGWNTQRDGSGDGYINDEVLQLTTSKALYAQWRANNKFTVSFDYQGGSPESGEPIYYKEVIQGNPYGDLPENLVKDGYLFGGWYTLVGGLGDQITKDTIFSKSYNETLYAKWTGADVTLSFNAGEASGAIADIQSKSGDKVKLPTNTDEYGNPIMVYDGYEFAGWSTSESATSATYEGGEEIVCPIHNTTYYAVWKQKFNITYHTNGGTNDGYTAKVYKVIEPINTERTDYTLVGWYANETLSGNMVTFPIKLTENKELWARWSKNE